MNKEIEVCIGTDRSGGVRVRLSLMLVDAGKLVMERYHSVMLAPGDDPAAVRAEVEAHIGSVDFEPAGPWPAIPDSEWNKVVGVIPLFHTADKIAKQAKLKGTV